MAKEVIKINCEECKKPFIRSRKDKRFCTDRCRASYRNYYGVDSTIRTNKTGNTGAISELLVCADLSLKGYNVFRAVSPSSPCDLVVLKGGELFRVEVTTARRTPTGGLVHQKKQHTHKFDILACVILETKETIYLSSKGINELGNKATPLTL